MKHVQMQTVVFSWDYEDCLSGVVTEEYPTSIQSRTSSY
jgi:hypothetical protein